MCLNEDLIQSISEKTDKSNGGTSETEPQSSLSKLIDNKLKNYFMWIL